MRLKTGVLIALFLAAIVAANLTLTHWGPDNRLICGSCTLGYVASGGYE
jgi:hypothetical protein